MSKSILSSGIGAFTKDIENVICGAFQSAAFGIRKTAH